MALLAIDIASVVPLMASAVPAALVIVVGPKTTVPGKFRLAASPPWAWFPSVASVMVPPVTVRVVASHGAAVSVSEASAPSICVALTA